MSTQQQEFHSFGSKSDRKQVMVQPSKLWYNPQNFEGCTITFSLYHNVFFYLVMKLLMIDQQIGQYIGQTSSHVAETQTILQY